MRRLAAALLAVLVLSGCAADRKPPADTAADRPARIVSLAPTVTEMLYAVGAGKQVVAVDDQSNYPAEVPKSDLSGFKPNAEAIAAKDPDLVVLTDDVGGIVAQLEKLKIAVYRAPAAENLDDTYTELTEIGERTGHEAEATAAVERMKDDVAAVVKDLPARPLTYYWELDPTFFSASSHTYIGSLLGLAGLKSVADGAGSDYPQLSAEAIVKADPDLVFLADTKCCRQSAATVAARPGWGGLKAVRTGQVYGLDDDIASRWGPRSVELLRDVVGAVKKVPSA